MHVHQSIFTVLCLILMWFLGVFFYVNWGRVRDPGNAVCVVYCLPINCIYNKTNLIRDILTLRVKLISTFDYKSVARCLSCALVVCQLYLVFLLFFHVHFLPKWFVLLSSPIVKSLYSPVLPWSRTPNMAAAQAPELPLFRSPTFQTLNINSMKYC